eukprot:885503-Amorphochlora_amoeboformis.AAC.2
MCCTCLGRGPWISIHVAVGGVGTERCPVHSWPFVRHQGGSHHRANSGSGNPTYLLIQMRYDRRMIQAFWLRWTHGLTSAGGSFG